MRNRKRNFFSSIMTVPIMLLAASFLFPGQKQAQAQDRSFVPLTLAAATDLHYIAPELTDGGECFTRLVENADGKAMAYCEEITDAFISQVTGEKPDALILTGDLTFNGAKASHEALAAKLSFIENAGIPVLVIPGNHDLNSTMAASFQGRSYTLVESVEAGQFAEIYGDFGYREALARDKASLSYVYELSPGLRILMLDVNTKEAPGTLTDDTFQWVRQQLKAARQAGDLVLAASHQTLLTHNRLFSDGYVIGNGSRLLELYEEYGVLCNLSGHIHIQHIAQSQKGLTEFVTSSLITSPCQYGILKVDPNELDYHTDRISFSHAAEAEQFFRDTAWRMASQLLPDAEDELYSHFTNLSVAYFSGRLDTHLKDEALFKDICARDPFIGFYLQSILEDGFQDHTQRKVTVGH